MGSRPTIDKSRISHMGKDNKHRKFLVKHEETRADMRG
jgi:hypothetical protein